MSWLSFRSVEGSGGRAGWSEGRAHACEGEREAQKTVEELKQVSARAAELEKERKEKAAGAERVKALEGELAGVKGERDARARRKGKQGKKLSSPAAAHQVQEELENVFLADQANQKQLEKLKQWYQRRDRAGVRAKERAAGAERVKALEGELAG